VENKSHDVWATWTFYDSAENGCWHQYYTFPASATAAAAAAANAAIVLILMTLMLQSSPWR